MPDQIPDPVTTDRNSDEADALDVILAASKPTPSASIPAAEVQALVERWRLESESNAKASAEFYKPSDAMRLHCADELAKLIPRNPE